MTGTRFVQIEQHWNDSYIYTAETYMPEENNTKKKTVYIDKRKTFRKKTTSIWANTW